MECWSWRSSWGAFLKPARSWATPNPLAGARSGATFIETQPDRLEYLVDQRGWYPYQRLPEEMAKRLQPLFSRFGIDVRRDIWVVVRPIPGAAGEYVNGNVIRISDATANVTDQRIAGGTAAHEVAHIVQHHILGDDVVNLFQYFEDQSWGRSRYGLKPGMDVPIDRVNPVSGEYALEGLADRFADEIFESEAW